MWQHGQLKELQFGRSDATCAHQNGNNAEADSVTVRSRPWGSRSSSLLVGMQSAAAAAEDNPPALRGQARSYRRVQQLCPQEYAQWSAHKQLHSQPDCQQPRLPPSDG